MRIRFCIINVVVILGSWMAATLSFVASSENGKNNNERICISTDV